jgi:hypothetical protein
MSVHDCCRVAVDGVRGTHTHTLQSERSRFDPRHAILPPLFKLGAAPGVRPTWMTPAGERMACDAGHPRSERKG